MPISFEQPQPFSAKASQQAGAADAMARTFGAMASIYQSDRANQLQANLANAQLMQRDRQFNDDMAERKSEFAANVGLRSDEMTLRANEASAHNMQRSIDTANHGVVQGWLQSQELSQQDAMRRQQLQSAVSAVESERGKGLTDEQANDLILQLKTRIDPLEQRHRMAQMRHMESQNKLLDEQAARLSHQQQADEAFKAATMGDTFQFVPDPRAKAGVEEEVADAMGLPASAPPVQQRVAEIMKERGLGQRFFMNNGKKEMHPADLEALKRSEKVGGSRGEVTAEDHLRMIQSVRKEVDSWAKSQDTPPSREAQDAEYERRMAQTEAGLAKFREQSATRGKPQPMPPEILKEKLTIADQQIAEISDRSDLPPQVKAQAVAIINRDKGLIAKYKSPELMPPEVRKVFQSGAAFIRSLPPNPVVMQKQADQFQGKIEEFFRPNAPEQKGVPLKGFDTAVDHSWGM